VPTDSTFGKEIIYCAPIRDICRHTTFPP